MNEMNALVLFTGIGSIVCTYSHVFAWSARLRDNWTLNDVLLAIAGMSFTMSCTAFVIWILKTY